MSAFVERRLGKPGPRVTARLPEGLLRKFAPLIAEIITEVGGVRISPTELRLAPDRVKFILPQREELEAMRRRGSFYLSVSINPEPVL